jgi:hypothetical protein
MMCCLLTRIGILDDTKASKKKKCWADYKAQPLYIDAMREAKEDPEFDPCRTHLVVGKDGRFEKISKSAKVVPKNPLTVQYLCHAYDIPYLTFKRCKADAFQTKTNVQAHLGKTVLTCPKLAAQVFNVRRMYCDHNMANRQKQIEFITHVHNRWGVQGNCKILWTMSDEKWWFGLVSRTFAKMCPALGIKKEVFSVHHKNHIAKV